MHCTFAKVCHMCRYKRARHSTIVYYQTAKLCISVLSVPVPQLFASSLHHLKVGHQQDVQFFWNAHQTLGCQNIIGTKTSTNEQNLLNVQFQHWNWKENMCSDSSAGSAVSEPWWGSEDDKVNVSETHTSRMIRSRLMPTFTATLLEKAKLSELVMTSTHRYRGKKP